MKVYYDKDADIQQIRNKKVAVIGYGSQGTTRPVIEHRAAGRQQLVAKQAGAGADSAAAEQLRRRRSRVGLLTPKNQR